MLCIISPKNSEGQPYFLILVFSTRKEPILFVESCPYLASAQGNRLTMCTWSVPKVQLAPSRLHSLGLSYRPLRLYYFCSPTCLQQNGSAEIDSGFRKKARLAVSLSFPISLDGVLFHCHFVSVLQRQFWWTTFLKMRELHTRNLENYRLSVEYSCGSHTLCCRQLRRTAMLEMWPGHERPRSPISEHKRHRLRRANLIRHLQMLEVILSAWKAPARCCTARFAISIGPREHIRHTLGKRNARSESAYVHLE